MKKFTTLEEDLIKESATAQEAFNKNYTEAYSKLDIIKEKLDEMKEKYQNDPRNWGYVGSMGHINEELEEILSFLGEEEPAPDDVLGNAQKHLRMDRTMNRME